MDVAELGFSIDSSQAASAADNLDKMSAASGRAQSATAKLQAQTDAMGASARAYVQFGREIQQFLESEAKDLEDVADRRYAYNQALQAGILTQKQASVALQELAKQEAALGVAAGGVTKAHGTMVAGMQVTSFQMMEVGRIVKDLATGQYSMLERSSLTLAGSTGLLSSAFNFLLSPIGAVVVALGAAAVALIAYYVGIAQRTQEFTQSIESNNAAAGLSVQAMLALHDQLVQIGISSKAATEEIVSLSNSGKFFGETFNQVAVAIAQFAQLTGDKVATVTKEFEKLGDTPTQTLLKILERLNEVNPAIVAMVANLQEQGQTLAATQLAASAAADATAKLTQQNQEYAKARAEITSLEQQYAFAARDGTTAASNLILSMIEQKKAALDAAQAQREHADALAYVANVANATVASFALANAKEREELTKTVATYGQGKTALIEYETQHQKMIATMQIVAAAFAQMNNAIASGTNPFIAMAQAMASARAQIVASNALIDQQRAGFKDLAAQIDAAKEAHKHHADAARVDEQAQQALFAANQKMDNIIAKLTGDTDAYAKAQAEFTRGMQGIIAASLDQAKANELLLADQGQITKQQMEARDAALARAAAEAQAAEASGNDAKAMQIWTDALKAAGIPQAQLTQLTNDFTKANKGQQDQLAKTDAEIKAHADGLYGLVDKYKKSIDEAAQLTAQQKAVAKATDDATRIWQEHRAELEKDGQTEESVREQLVQMAQVQTAFKEAFSGLENNPITNMVNSIDVLTQALAKAKDGFVDFGKDVRIPIAQVQKGIDQLNLSLADKMLGAAGAALKGIQSFSKEGSKSYAEMKIAIDTLAIAQAVLAVIAQGALPPPASFIAMAAMVATVAPLLADIGASISTIKGPSASVTANTAANVQATQGTGTVLGDITKQSDSINKAMQITADSTSKLVGISTGMLDALRSLQQAIGGAATMLARGAGSASFSSSLLNASSSGPPALPFTGMDQLNNILFGGSKKIIDQGVEILGGAISDLLSGTIVSAYETIKKSGGLFGSDSTKVVTSALGDDFNRQMQLVLGSIVDTVKQAAIALGLPLDDINAKIAAFKVAETKISLKGLSAEDQQKALEAVFSSIFDGLAGAVVPFIAQFQQVGEGLGETLVRVATEVQVTQQAMKQLGFAVDTTDPEKFAQIADGLIQMAGGVDAFISQMNAFTNDFAPDSFKFQTAKDALVSGLGQVGLTLPDTREGFFELMQSLDASTAAGQKQIATLLRLTDVANTYYDLLDKQQTDATQKAQQLAQATDAYNKFIAQFDTTESAFSQFEVTMVNLGESIANNIAQANQLAIAAGKSGASLEDIGKIITGTIAQGVKYVQALYQQVQQEAASLFGTPDDQLQQRIDALQARVDHFKSTGQYDYADQAEIVQLKQQLAQQQAQEKAQQQFLQASTLIGDLGQLGAVTGQSLDQLAEKLHIPLDQLAKYLGTNADGLKAQFKQQEDIASAALATAGNTKEMMELLADINATLNGQALPYDPGQIANAASPPPKPVAHGYTPPGGGSAQPADNYTTQNQTSSRGSSVAATNRGAAPPSRGDSQPVVAAIKDGTDHIANVTNNRMDRLEREFVKVSQRLDRFINARVPA